MDNNKILEKVRMKIAISNVKEEDIVMNKNKLKMVKSIGIAACIVFSMTGIVLAKTQIISKFGKNSSDGIQTAINNGYYSDINTEYKKFNGIGVNIESFLLDDNNFDMIVNMKFDSNYNLQDMLLNGGSIDIMDLKVVNEKNEMIFSTMQLKEQKNSNNKDNDMRAYSMYSEKINDNEIKIYITATSNKKEFPKSKKLIITFNRIKNEHTLENNVVDELVNINSVYEGEWKYELDVPESMVQSSVVNYKLVSISDENYKFEGAKLSNTAFKIYLSNCKEIDWNDNECVETSNGKKFYPTQKSDGDGEISLQEDGSIKYYQTFNLTKYDATDKLKVHIFKANGEEVIVNLVKDN